MPLLIKLDLESKVGVTMFIGIISSLLYLNSSRLDIILSICLCARYQADLKEFDLSIIKGILRYLIGT